MLTWVNMLPTPQKEKVLSLLSEGYVCPWQYRDRVYLWSRCPHQSLPDGSPMRDHSRARLEVCQDGSVVTIEPPKGD